MCGICGIIKFDGAPVKEASLRKMMSVMKHRGPDDEGLFAEGNVGLGFVRLSIIDLSASGHQPMYSDDGRYIMVFNGEIYNYIELRKELKQNGIVFKSGSDSEVLLKSYIFWGRDAVNKFNGMWSFVIYDKLKKEIFASRDRYGVKPFYYYFDNKSFIFCSEIQPILAVLDKKPEPEWQVIFDYLVFSRTDQTEATFFNGVKKLQHGHCLYFSVDQNQKKNADLNPQKWYDLKQSLREPFKNPEEFYSELRSSVVLRLRSDVPVGVCLSGGLDSSTIVSVIANDIGKKDLNTFSAVYQKGEHGDEREYIEEFRPTISNMHFTTPTYGNLISDLSVYVKAHGEPIPQASPYAQFKVMELAGKYARVTLDGQGADEELAGYHYFFGIYFKELLKRLNLGRLSNELYYYGKNHKSLFGYKTFIYFLLPDFLKVASRTMEKGYLDRNFIHKYSSDNKIVSTLYASSSLEESLIDHFEYKLEHLLKWGDRNSMWFSVESRAPFLDYRIVERVLSMPSDMKIRNGVTKHLLREAMNGRMSEKIRLRSDKLGFDTPQAQWFRSGEFQQLVNKIVSSDSFRNRGIYDLKKVREKYDRHLSGRYDYSADIWKWIHLEYWFKEYID